MTKTEILNKFKNIPKVIRKKGIEVNETEVDHLNRLYSDGYLTFHVKLGKAYVAFNKKDFSKGAWMQIGDY